MYFVLYKVAKITITSTIECLCLPDFKTGAIWITILYKLIFCLSHLICWVQLFKIVLYFNDKEIGQTTCKCILFYLSDLNTNKLIRNLFFNLKIKSKEILCNNNNYLYLKRKFNIKRYTHKIINHVLLIVYKNEMEHVL